MSFGDSTARIAVATAVTLLPAALRKRYREQWMADLRDAADVGIRRSEIAWGSLAFAATVDRIALESERSQSTVVVEGRERFGFGCRGSRAHARRKRCGIRLECAV
jgi:hypothetical protein